ncbi:MAG TPA: hypothetical protein VHB68_19015 [Steroidobacteraceae bacterium]|nr:hypothetical protein [Steroidobacteraceae bacterium]
MMQILVDAADPIDGGRELMLRVEGLVEGSLERFREHIARVEVHLSQLSHREAGDRDMCCRMVAYAGGLKPIEVVYAGLTLTEAIHAAAAQLEQAVHAAIGRPRHKDEPAGPGHAEPELGH